MRILGKAILSHLVAALLPLLLFAGLSVVALEQHMRVMLQDDLSAAAGRALIELEQPLGEAMRDAQAWASLPAMAEVATEVGGLGQEIGELLTRYDILDALAVLDRDGIVVASTEAAARGRSFAGAGFFLGAMAEGRHLGALDLHPLTGRPGIGVAVAIGHGPEAVAGVLVAVIDWTVIAAELGRIEVLDRPQDPDRRILILSRDQDRIVHGLVPGIDAEALSGVLADGTATTLELGSEAWHLRAAAPHPGANPLIANFVAYAVVSDRVARAFTDHLTTAGLVVAAFGLLATAMLGYVMAMNLARPIKRVTGNLARALAGDHDQPLLITGRSDEIGDMSKALDAFHRNLVNLEKMSREQAISEGAERGKLAAALEALEHPLAVWDAHGRYVLGNRAFASLMESFGIPTEALNTYRYHDIEQGLLQVGEIDERSFAIGGSPRDVEMDVVLSDGRVLRVVEHATADGGAVSAWFDITAFRRRETALAMLANDQRAGRPFQELAIEVMVIGLGMRYAGITRLGVDGGTATLQALCEGQNRLPPFSYALAGSPCHRVIENREIFAIPAGATDRFPSVAPLAQCPGAAYVGVPYCGAEGDVAGHLFAIGDARAPLSADEKQFVSVIARWVEAQHERAKAVQELSHQANFDALTGLPNRNLALDRLGLALARARRHGDAAAALFIDLDNFKTVNDTLGHLVGDHLLRLAAQRLVHCVREEDTVSRLGGDEFLVILPALRDGARAEAVARKVIAAMAQPFTVHGHELYVTASVGITVFPADGDTPAEIMRNADAAMYLAKQKGRNCSQFFTARLNQEANERLRIESRLRHVLERDELQLNYQPLVHLGSGRLLSAEALLRWTNPDLGSVPPDRFIPLAEETDLIIDIGRWVIERACRDLAAWQAGGLHGLRIAVNVSSRQFQDDGLVELVAAVLSRHGIDPACLELEITERLLLRKDARTEAMMKRLREIGVRFSIDDFGTGYSAMSYLTSFPFDVLKIDRSFVRNAAQSEQDAKLAQAMIAMAHSLGLEVVGEGVEDVGDVDFLRRHDCDFAQGYFFSRPLPSEAFQGWARRFQSPPGPIAAQ